MRKILLFVGAVIAGMSFSGAASAQGTPFEGYYLGGYLSYSKVDVEFGETAGGSVDEDMDGFGGGALIGFGGTNGQYYGSIEGHIGYDGAQWDESFSVPNFGTGTVDIEAQLNFGFSGRFGLVMADRYLLYGKLGYVRTNTELSVQANLNNFGAVSVSDDEWFDGFRFGGGLEGMVADNVAIRGEYTYTIYNDPDIAPGIEIDADQHLILLGVAYYF